MDTQVGWEIFGRREKIGRADFFNTSASEMIYTVG